MKLDLNGIHALAQEQGIDAETVDAALSEALRLAYLKMPHAAKYARVELDPRAGSFTIWARDEIPQEPTEDNPHPAPELGEEYDDTPHDFGRLAASTARQVIQQLFRKAEDDRVFGAFSGQRGKLITGVVQQDVKDPANVHVAVGDVEALLPRREQVPGERYRHGERIRVYVTTVARGLKEWRSSSPVRIRSSCAACSNARCPSWHPEPCRSWPSPARRAPVRRLPCVPIRQASTRRARSSHSGGSRVRAVMENLGSEKIDIIDWSANPAEFIAAALSPAVVSDVQVISEKNQTAIAFINDEQLSLAIGKEGQNARLAAKLTGWKIGIESNSAHAAKLREQAAKAADGTQSGNAEESAE